MQDIETIMERLLEFRDARDWHQFHNPKDLSLTINVEAGELLELFLWKQPEQADRQRVKEELAVILAYCFLPGHKYGFDIKEILLEKITANDLKYL